MNNEFIIYTTIGCHLCSDVLNDIAKIIKDNSTKNITIVEFDIFSDKNIEMKFWDKIPVIKSPANEYLYFPFDYNALTTFLCNDYK